jgi:hypothetical protein
MGQLRTKVYTAFGWMAIAFTKALWIAVEGQTKKD